MPATKSMILFEELEPRILSLRGQRIIIDADLAELYGVTTKRLNEQVKRNSTRFPKDFLLHLNQKEKLEVVANCDHLRKLKFSKSLPYAFTEHGAIMAAAVLNSPQAIEVSVYVVRAFVKLREVVASHKELAHQLNELERKVGSHDEAIRSLVTAIRQLMTPVAEPLKKGRIGFRVAEET